MTDTNQAVVACGCGRNMALDARRGRGAYRCGCGARTKVSIPTPQGTRCVGTHQGEACRLPTEITEPLPLCADHFTSTGLRRFASWVQQTDETIAMLVAVELEKGNRRRVLPGYEGAVAEQDIETWAKSILRERGGYSDQTDDDRGALREEFRTKAERDEETGSVYFIRSGNAVKIGKSFDPLKRFAQIQAPNTELLATEPGYTHRERMLHLKFSKFRLNGEWFSLEPALVRYINYLREEAGDAPINLSLAS
ncbi:GIY-YIG nuclease family protein [Embleya sp. NPDC005971]|uniref:GIY-YIG nuclease family protein n=1 Tax=Embleya sp. NPDC005971 TaxID=3156724 RepID=UPI0033CD9259